MSFTILSIGLDGSKGLTLLHGLEPPRPEAGLAAPPTGVMFTPGGVVVPGVPGATLRTEVLVTVPPSTVGLVVVDRCEPIILGLTTPGIGLGATPFWTPIGVYCTSPPEAVAPILGVFITGGIAP